MATETAKPAPTPQSEPKPQAETPDGGAKPAALASLEPQKPVGGIENLDFILDVPLKVTVHIGNTRMVIRDLLQLGQGSVIELEKMAGEPMDVFIGDRLVARGEVVVVNEKFGVRLSDIVSPVERIKQLQKK